MTWTSSTTRQGNKQKLAQCDDDFNPTTINQHSLGKSSKSEHINQGKPQS